EHPGAGRRALHERVRPCAEAAGSGRALLRADVLLVNGRRLRRAEPARISLGLRGEDRIPVLLAIHDAPSSASAVVSTPFGLALGMARHSMSQGSVGRITRP